MTMEKEEREGEVKMVLGVEMTANDFASASAATIAAIEEGGREEITPLLPPQSPPKPKLNIFSLPYSKLSSSSEMRLKEVEVEVAPLDQIVFWMWNGTRYSGLLCMAFSSVIYFLMEVLSDIFSVGKIPLYEILFARCAIVLLLSFVWLRKTGQPVFGPTHTRTLLVARALTGLLSLLSFIYSIQSLPLHNALVLSFTTPVMASILARIILHEKLTLIEMGGLASSIFGLFFIFQTKGGLIGSGEPSNSFVVRGNHPIFSVLVGLFSSTTSGISYCLIRAAGKASDQPVVTVFAFGLLATPISAICSFSFKDFVLPNFYSFFPMVLLGILAFFAEVLLARGLQLEKTSKVANMQYIEALLSQIWGIALLRVAPSFGGLVGCFFIMVSLSITFYFVPEKE